MDFGRRLSREGGYSLIEVMIAVFILTSVFLFIVGMFAQDTRMNRRNESKTEALRWAEETIENLKAMKFDELASRPLESRGGLRRIISVGYYPDDGSGGTTNMKYVEVTISWDGSGSGEESLSLKTLIGDRR